MPEEVTFAGLNVALRTPRVAVVFPADSWQVHARRTIEFFSQTWGGSAGVVVPEDAGIAHAAVIRLLRSYDPDYVTTVGIGLSDAERLWPGRVSLKDADGNPIPAEDRTAFIEKAELAGPRMLDVASDQSAVAGVAKNVNGFEEDGDPRIISVYPRGDDAQAPLSGVTTDAVNRVLIQTGDPLLDLAVAMRNGLPTEATDTRRLADGSITRQEIVAVLMGSGEYQIGAPFRDTGRDLASITIGVPSRRRGPLVVLGGTAHDFALAMLWDRTVGPAIWLPITARHSTWRAEIGVTLDRASEYGRRPLQVTSTSMPAPRCQSLLEKIWQARYVKAKGEKSQPWQVVGPHDVMARSRIELRLRDRWDERFSVPIRVSDDGAAEMVTTFPLLAPEDADSETRSWIVDVAWPQHPIKQHPALSVPTVLADHQNPYETFVRATRLGIAFESGRWDFVHSGASKYGQLAQPKLRWPSLLDTLNTIAQSTGHRVEPSHAGRVAQIAAMVWGGRDYLLEDLSGHGRELVDAFVAPRGDNGPIDKAKNISNDSRRLRNHNRCLVPFNALVRLLQGKLSEVEIRTWLDRRLETGAVRMGTILGCGICPWVDFYRTDEFGAAFTCARCGSSNTVTHARWREPDPGPHWYYEVHPTAFEFIEQNGDVPLLAVHRYARQIGQVVFELDVLKGNKTKPEMEVDFAFLDRDRLVIGEAKRPGKLDGKNAAERIEDVKKLLDAARILDASEICFATGTAWDAASRTAIASAVTSSGTSVTVTLLEGLLTDDGPMHPKIEHNPAGP
jgi:hypothetical protein